MSWLLLLPSLLGATPDECLELHRALRYREAAGVCQRAVEAAPRERLVELYRALAESFAVVGDGERARAAFVSLLALSPDAKLPAGTSPKLLVPFDEARKPGTGAPVRLTGDLRLPALVGEEVALRIRVDDGPARPIARVAGVSGGQTRTAARETDTVDLALPAPGTAGRLAVTLAAFDRFGGKLADSSMSVEVAQRPNPRPAWLSWKVWGGGALVASGVGVGAGTYALRIHESAQREAFADATAAGESSARRAALAANASYGLAAALAVGATVLYLTEPARK